MNVDRGYACAISIVDAPCPQPTSATRAPSRSFASTPSSAGSQAADQVGAVAGAEEPLAPGEHVRRRAVPAEPVAGAERLGDLRLGAQRAERELERARREDRAVRVGQRERLLLGERVRRPSSASYST